MPSLNEVTLLGHLGADPEMRYTPGGKAVANFRMATSENWTKDGEKKEKTEWHRVVAWDKLGELCGQYLTKGKQCLVKGKLQTREWEKDGQKRYQTEIVAHDVIFLGGGAGADRSSGPGERSASPPAARPPAAAKPTGKLEQFMSAPPPSDEDVPF